MKNTLQTVLTISNTDIVTIVKQKGVNLKSSNSKTKK
jgi:hypothetical protein